MGLFPIFVKMAARPALVVGGGPLAAAKIESLLMAGAAVTVVASEVTQEIARRSESGEIDWLERGFQESDVKGKVIVFAATGVRESDRAVFPACVNAGVWCNAIDDPEYCDFYMPAIVRRGDLQIAISTNGQSPALAQQIRKDLEMKFDASWSAKLQHLGRRRRQVLATFAPGEERTSMLHEQARAALAPARNGIVRRSAVAVRNWLNREDDKVALI